MPIMDARLDISKVSAVVLGAKILQHYKHFPRGGLGGGSPVRYSPF